MTHGTLEKYHRKYHRWGPVENCWSCGRQRAICKSKLRYDTPEAADVVVRETREREQYTRPVARYHCRWCDGWHLTTHPKGAARHRVERARRKWLFQEELKRRLAKP